MLHARCWSSVGSGVLVGFQEGVLGWEEGGRSWHRGQTASRPLLNWVGSRLDFPVAPSGLCPQRFLSEVTGILCPSCW